MRNCSTGWIAAVLLLLAACSGGPNAPPAGNQPAGDAAAPSAAATPPAAADSAPAPSPDAAPSQAVPDGVSTTLPPVVYVSATGERLTAVFDNAAGTVRVTLPGGRQVTLPQALSGSGARYSDGKETFWEHHGDGTYTVGDKVVFEGKALETE